jgi:hypothetical protein
MNLSSCVSGVFVSWMIVIRAVADEPCNSKKSVDQIIPFNQIVFATSREFHDLEPELFEYRDTPEKIAKYSTPDGLKEFERIIQRAKKESIGLAIERASREMDRVGPGFAVEGQGRPALKGIYDVVVNGKEPQQHFPTGKELSIVFYSRPMQPGVRLENVSRTGEHFEIRYLLISHGNLSIAPCLALIPVGKLPSGKYRVDMKRCLENEAKFSERGFPPVEVGWEKDYVCQPFSFVVKERK